MSDEICECGHSINKHYLDNPSEGEPSGYCTHYYENKHVFCNCRKSPGEIAASLRARVGELELERDELINRVNDFMLKSGERALETSNDVQAAVAIEKENAKLKRELETAKKVAVYFYNLGYGVRPSIWSKRLIENYAAALAKGAK